MSKAEDYELDSSKIKSISVEYEQRALTELPNEIEGAPLRIIEHIKQYAWTNVEHTIFADMNFKHLIESPIPNYYCPEGEGYHDKKYQFSYMDLGNLSEEIRIEGRGFDRRVAICVPSELDNVKVRLADKTELHKALKTDIERGLYPTLMKVKKEAIR